MWAARRSVTLVLEIEVQADYDTRSGYGVDGIEAGYRQVRCVVKVAADGSAEQVAQVLEEANRASPYLHVWREPQDDRIEIRGAPGD